MGIQSLKETLSDVPGIHSLVMTYEDGGKVQVFSIGDVSARVGPAASTQEIKAALLKAIEQQ